MDDRVLDKKLIDKLSVLFVLIVLLISVFFVVKSYFNTVELYERAVSNEIEMITKKNIIISDSRRVTCLFKK
jgi:hypothetical protein